MALIHLRVQNLGVLGDAAIEPGPGLTVITGETGAGKTLLVDGLRLILGERSDTSAVGPQADDAQADGLFETDDGELGVTRIVPKEGRSRCLLDGAIVSTGAVAAVVGELVEIVAQHDQLGLRRPSQVLALIDECLDDAGMRALDAYRDAWVEWRWVEEKRMALSDDPQAVARELDLLSYQLSEIEKARLEPGEDEKLETEASRLRNLEEIAEHLSESARLASRLSDDGGEVVSRLRKVSSLDSSSARVGEAAEAMAAAIADLGTGIRVAIDGLDVDPGRQEEVEARLTLIGDLKRKYGKTLDEVLEYAREASRRATELAAASDGAERLEERTAAATRTLHTAARHLSHARRRAGERLVGDIQAHLGALAMAGAVVQVRLEDAGPGPDGADRAELWFSSHPHLDPAPLSSAASGGELSRLVLAVRLATRGAKSTTMVFDEVDSGVGGAVALALGRRLAELAESNQVLCVTHLGQVAAHAGTHYAIERVGASAVARRVTGEDRLGELARMIAGSPDSPAGRRTAKELLSAASSG